MTSLYTKAKSYSLWLVNITSETVNLDQSECRKIDGHLEVYTNITFHPISRNQRTDKKNERGLTGSEAKSLNKDHRWESLSLSSCSTLETPGLVSLANFR